MEILVKRPDDAATLTGEWRDYLRLARFDHVTKHVFILPGIVLAMLLRQTVPEGLVVTVLLGLMAAVAIASANYVINEWLDRTFDVHHPEKSQRAAVRKELDPRIVYGQYGVLVAAGLAIAAMVSTTFLVVAALFALAGVIYNVRPMRTKDLVYVDVLTESLNNSIRLTLGWVMVDPSTLPPASLLLGFWFGGAFLMNSKRLAEYRDIVASAGRDTLHLYRRSFRSYTEARLSVANLVYALACGFFAAVFLIKYRIEYIILFPFITALFAEYYALALQSNSVARKPEKLFQARRLMGITAALVLAFVLATFVDIAALEWLADQHFISITGRAVN
jgi:4-hydroxybenzoate polyprenyltransferase